MAEVTAGAPGPFEILAALRRPSLLGGAAFLGLAAAGTVYDRRTSIPYSAATAMSTAETEAKVEAWEPGSRIRSSSPRQIPVIGVVTEEEEAQVWPGGCAWEGVKAEGRDEAWVPPGGKWGPKWKSGEPPTPTPSPWD